MLALVARLAGLFRQAAAASALSREASRQFSELADRTSDAVLVCDRDGTIEYASPAVVHFGYSPDQLTGTSLAELVHPEDRASGTRVALARGRRLRGAGPVRLPGARRRRHLAARRVDDLPVLRAGRRRTGCW